MPLSYSPSIPAPGIAKRADLHCHSRASTESDEAVLIALGCAESYSEPRQIHEQAKRRGMDFVTITDHDSISGVLELAYEPDVLVGEELTCWFPEDRCKIHVLVWGIGRAEHDTLQKLSPDIHQVAEYMARNNIAHAVAHPLYRQNGKLERWHVERLLLLFKGFECLNGAHSMLHRDAFEPLLDEMDESRIRKLQRSHGRPALWNKPWLKSRTGGSDDHGLFNIGRTWTEFPADVTSVPELLDCIREGRCRPGGEAGSSLKLAHNFFGVGIRYYTQELAGGKRVPALTSAVLGRLVGDSRPVGKLALAAGALGHLGRKAARKLGVAVGLSRPGGGTAMLADAFLASAQKRFGQRDPLTQALRECRPLLAEHEAMFALVADVSRDAAQSMGATGRKSIDAGQIQVVFDLLSAVTAQQTTLLPYYFALFHQNQERHLLRKITGHGPCIDRQTLRVGMFTDTFDAADPAGRFANQLAAFAKRRQLQMVVHTCSETASFSGSYWRNFQPWSKPQTILGGKFVVPPVLEMLEWSDRQQFDAVVCNTCGPVGLTGWLVSKMLRVPMLSAYHSDLPAQVLGRTNGDYRATAAARGYARWFYARSRHILARSRTARDAAARLTGTTLPCTVLEPAVERETPLTTERAEFWRRHGVREPIRIACPGDFVSTKDMQLVVDTFDRVWRRRKDVALVIGGAGHQIEELKSRTRGLPVYILPAADSSFYGAADLTILPNHDDLSGQAAIDAQMAGTPVVVPHSTAAAEFVDNNITGLVMADDEPATWAKGIVDLLADDSRRRVARSARDHIAALDPTACFESLWEQCLLAANPDLFGPRPQDSDEPAEPTNFAEVIGA